MELVGEIVVLCEMLIFLKENLVFLNEVVN